jgi:hypothetical protein
MRGRPNSFDSICFDVNLGAGDGDRTRMASLEGWSSTIELHPRVPRETRTSLRYRCVQSVLGPDSFDGQLS